MAEVAGDELNRRGEFAHEIWAAIHWLERRLLSRLQTCVDCGDGGVPIGLMKIGDALSA